MAQATMTSSQLRLIFHDGDNLETGKPILKAKSFSNVKTSALADGLYAVAQAYESLQELPLEKVERRDDSDIDAE